MSTPTVLSPQVPSNVYCNPTTDIDDIFGKPNVDKWALLSQLDPTSVAGLAEIAARRQTAIQYATAYIEDRLRDGPYALPLLTADGFVPRLIVQLVATYAGVWLYENRGTIDCNVESGQPEHRYSYKVKWVEKTLDQIVGRKIKLAIVASGSGRGTNAPFVTRTPNARGQWGSDEIDGPILP